SLSLTLRLPSSTLFPYTTLFRSPSSLVTGSCEEGRCLLRVQIIFQIVRFVAGGEVARGRGLLRCLLLLAEQLLQLLNVGLQLLRSEEHTSELQSRENLVCRLLLE